MEGNEFWIDEVTGCPLCRSAFENGRGIVQEYWVAGERHLDLWCSHCQRHTTLVFASRVVTREPAGNPHLHP